MSEEKNLFRKFSSFMDQNIRGVQYGIYSVAGIGLILALRSVRPFAKFCFPSDIPSHFIVKKVPLVGKVTRIEPGSVGVNPCLLVDHQPIIALPKKNKNDGLPIEILSVSITNNGFLWLQSLLINQDISFVPMKVSKDRVYCIVSNQKQNVGEQLIKIGFATVSPIDLDLEKDQHYLKYYTILLSKEKQAERKGAGVWADSKIPLSKLLLNKFKSVLPYSLFSILK